VAALGGLVAGASLAGAESQPPDQSPHLLLVPDTPRADAALERSSARTVGRYGAFTLVEARGEDDTALRDAGADRRDDMRKVSLPGGQFDPLRGRESLAGKDAADPNEALAVVQFAGPVKDAWLERLRDSGVRVVQYVPQNGYLVHASGGEVDRLAALVGTDPAVRAVTRVTGEDKKSEDLAAGGDDSRLVAVQTLAGADGADARRAAAAAGPRARGGSSVGELETQFVSLSGAEIDALASDPAVVGITPYSMPRLLDERSAQIVAGNFGLETAPGGYRTWLDDRGFNTTFGFAIDVTDTGLDTGSEAPAPAAHPDFNENGVPSGISRVAYAHEWTNDPSANDCSGHGTNVASIAAGFGSESTPQPQDGNGFKYGMGAAPRARIGASKIFSCAGQFELPDPHGALTGFSLLARSAHERGARISNNSWGNADLGTYSVDSQKFDSLVRDVRPDQTGNQQMIEVFAAGNDGDDTPGSDNEGWASIASPGTAKNVITVGASESSRPLGGITCGVDDGGADNPGDIADFSSRGPTDDGRLKPDIVAPGTRVVGAAPQTGAQYTGQGVCLKSFGSPFYSLQSGTSQATPAVSGAAALIYAWYDRAHPPPSPALTKAILVNTAMDLAGGHNGKDDVIGSAPNADQGWGRAHLGAALENTPREYVDQTERLTGSGDRFGRAYTVQDDNRPLKVTLAWTDPPGPTGAGRALVNDLDLVVRQGGRTYKGNRFAGGASITGGDADTRNNLESATLPEATGRFSVEVIGANIAGDGVPGGPDSTDQDFALVVSNAQAQPAPVLAPEEAVISDQVPEGDGDSFLERDERFELDVDLRNGGDADASNVSGPISATGLSFTQDAGDWGNIPQGDAATTTVPFAGEVLPTTTCGEDLTATLALNGGQGSLPVTLPTGEPGVPQATPLRTHAPPLSIPDESSVGATSTIAVNTPGLVKDMNVTLGNLTHSWVGDLVIELTSPEGTTVRLVQHPGGPDNGGDNFINTVFDDEASTNISDAGAPYAGSFRPQNDQLSRFDGEQRQGTWTLRVRDLFEGDAGTLTSWQTTTRRAICDLTDHTPPDTAITARPPALTTSRTASFSFQSTEAEANFDCSLDGAPATACDSQHVLGDLGDGAHTLRVQARDSADNLDPSPAEWSWTVDTTAPAVSLSTPGQGTLLRDARPQLAGSGGLAAGDAGTVTVKLWRGSVVAGLPVQTLSVPRDAASGAWSTRPATLADGTWTARAEQADAAGNIGASPPVTFVVGTAVVDDTATDFAVVPVESDLADARAGRLTVLAGCGSDCRVSAELRAGGRRREVLGRAGATIAAQRSRPIKVKLTRKGRSALRKVSTLKARLRVTVDGAGPPLRLDQALVLREVDLRRVARRGLPFTGKCAEQCSIAANLLLSARDARRHGLRAPGSEPLPVAGDSARPSATTSRLVLRLSKASRKALLRARRVNLTLDAKVSAPPGPPHRTSYRLTLRR
jgi:subtilisin-like proprotein convertase family protein